MDKLRKILIVIWLAKERIVLLLMVGFLCYRVWMVFQEADGGENTVPPPRPPVVDGAVDASMPPPEPRRPVAPPTSQLQRSNPFWLFSRPGASTEATGSTEEALPEMTLLSVQDMRGTPRARIRSGTSRWYTQGMAIGKTGFIVGQIDVAAATVEVENPNTGQRVVLTPEN